MVGKGLGGAALTALLVALIGLMPGAGIHWPKITAVVVSFFAVCLARTYLVFRSAWLLAGSVTPVTRHGIPGLWPTHDHSGPEARAP